MTPRVVLGLGGGIDIELKLSARALEQLIDEYHIRLVELTTSAPVNTERDLVVSILAHIARGGGGEHFVASAGAIQTFAERFPSRITLGGTSVRAGITMSRLGVPTTLHLVTLNQHVRDLMPASCDYVSSGHEDTFYPHLIVQYDQDIDIRAGDVQVRASFANRLIYVNDPDNEILTISEELGGMLREARLFLVSGFNAVRDPQVLDQRLRDLRRHMEQLPDDALVYLEDAAYHEPAANQRVRDELLDVMDIFGLNEDEMQTELGRSVDLLSTPDVEAAINELRRLIPIPTLVLHTKHWSAAVGLNAADYTDSLDIGMAMASTRYSYGDDFSAEQYERIATGPRGVAATRFAAELNTRMGPAVMCRPGFTLNVAEPTTVGLGDAFVGGFLTALARKKADQWT